MAGIAVDIVINNYNYARFLPAAIESALVQTHPAVNVIVVDDGSTDESGQILDRYADRVTLVRKENGGQASALNAGFERCDGEIVIFLDADDTLHAQAAATVAEALNANPTAVKVQYRLALIDAGGEPTGDSKPAAHMPMPSGDVRAEELAYPYDLVWMSTSGNAFRRVPLSRIMPMPVDHFRTCADWYLVHLSALLGPVISLSSVDGSYRMHGENNYEPQTADLDLDHIRETIRFAAATSPLILELADELGLDHPERILSIADLANRMISAKLEPALHPIAGERPRQLLGDAVRAARRRTNVSAAMRAMFVGWFAAMLLSPRRLARRLAVYFLFPERRPAINALLGRLQGSAERRPAESN
jgi:Glycosyl transferase family 2